MRARRKAQPGGPVNRIPVPGAGVEIDLRPEEFLFPRSTVTVATKKPLDAEAARRAIGVARAANAVKVGRERTTAVWSPPPDLPPGRHIFQVGPLLSADGKEVEPALQIPFHFVRSQARIPAGVAVGSFVRASVGAEDLERLPLGTTAGGPYVELVKGTDRSTGAPVALAFDENGRRVNEVRILRGLERVRAARLGKLDEALHRRLASAKAAELVRVAVWAQTRADEEIQPADKRTLERATGAPREPAASRRRREAIAERSRALAETVKEAGGRDVQADEAAPVAFARLRKAEIAKLAERKEVAGVFLYDPEGIDDIGNSIAIANSDDVHAAGQTGAGVNVAVWENGPTSTANLVITAAFDSSPTTSNHSQLVHGIVRNNQRNRPHGHAPGCALHSANSKDLSALRWAVRDRRCTVINQSFHRPAEPESGAMSFDDVYKDWLVLTSPYPTILQAAGNYWEDDPDDIDPPSDEFVNHKGYNSLAVANHDDSAGAMSSSSVFRNPTSSHGDRELPEISANGTNVTAAGVTDSGTSMASPAVAGVAALLQDQSATLRSWPEGSRAILLAGATRNVVGDTWWRDVVDDDDASDGSGAVNALESHRIVGSRRGRDASPTRRGWDVGTLDSDDFDADGLSRFAYRVLAPRHWFGPRHVKVALAWNSKVTTISFLGITFPISSQLTVDLDLLVFDRTGAQVGYSGSWDNSYEIAEFDAVPGESYDIRIRRWSGTDWTWYGIAWTTTGSLLDLELIQGSGATRLATITEGLSRIAE
jgi:Subtilase family